MSLAVHCPSSPAAILNAVSELESLRAQRAVLVQQKQAADARKSAAETKKASAEGKKSAALAKQSQSTTNRAALADLMKLVQAAPTRPSAGTTAAVAKKTLA